MSSSTADPLWAMDVLHRQIGLGARLWLGRFGHGHVSRTEELRGNDRQGVAGMGWEGTGIHRGGALLKMFQGNSTQIKLNCLEMCQMCES